MLREVGREDRRWARPLAAPQRLADAARLQPRPPRQHRRGRAGRGGLRGVPVGAAACSGCRACSRRPGANREGPSARGSRARERAARARARRARTLHARREPRRAGAAAGASGPRRGRQRVVGRGERGAASRARICSSSARSVGVWLHAVARRRGAAGAAPALVSMLEHAPRRGPGKSSISLLEVVDRAGDRSAARRARAGGLARRRRRGWRARRSAFVRARSISSCVGAKRSTLCTTTHVLPASLWSTRPLHEHDLVDRQRRLVLGQRLAEHEHLDRALEVVERREHHVVAVAGADALGLGDDPADRHPVLVAAVGERGERAVDARAQRLAQRLQRVRGDEQPDRLLLGRQQLGLLELLGGDRRVHRRGERRRARRPTPARRRRPRGSSLRGRRSSPGRSARPAGSSGRRPGPARAPRACPCGSRPSSRARRT